jgi:hypothetical protein
MCKPYKIYKMILRSEEELLVPNRPCVHSSENCSRKNLFSRLLLDPAGREHALRLSSIFYKHNLLPTAFVWAAEIIHHPLKPLYKILKHAYIAKVIMSILS